MTAKKKSWFELALMGAGTIACLAGALLCVLCIIVTLQALWELLS